MTAPVPAVPEYGIGGDYAGARRGRRAFRFCVAFCVALSGSLWFSENYLRYDKGESQYRMALTHEDPSARPILRNVVKRDAEQNATPRVRYVEALAAVEEDDLVLAGYEQAYRLNPGDSFLIIKYGCQLYLHGNHKDARERFREAGIQPPKNALPHYLEAAALAAGAAPEEDLSEAVALIARANSGGDPILFPAPLWHPSLMKGGDWYVRKQRELIDLSCMPLFRLRNALVSRAALALDKNEVQDWDSWLEKLQVLGERLMGGGHINPESLGASQAAAGIQIQLDALRLRNAIAAKTRGASSPDFAARIQALEKALSQITVFYGVRDAQVQTLTEVYQHPLFLIGKTLLMLVLVYLFSVLASRAVDRRKTTYALPHRKSLGGILAAGSSLLFLLLSLSSVLQREAPGSTYPEHLLTWVWYGLLGFLLLFGVLYPWWRLPTATLLIERMEVYEDAGAALRQLQRLRRRAAITLVRRYFGLLLGLFLCIVSGWTVSYRIAYSTYPMQLKLLVPGLEQQERQVVSSAQELLE